VEGEGERAQKGKKRKGRRGENEKTPRRDLASIGAKKVVDGSQEIGVKDENDGDLGLVASTMREGQPPNKTARRTESLLSSTA